jgi:hypothetical protein
VLDVHTDLVAVADTAHRGHQAHRLVRLDHDLIPSTGGPWLKSGTRIPFGAARTRLPGPARQPAFRASR